MENTAIERAQQFAAGMVHSLALYQAMEQLKGQPEEIQKQVEPMILALVKQLNPAEA